jgi:hypothetical protein
MTASEPDWLHTIWSEVEKLKKPLARLNPRWFTLEASLAQ